MPMFEYGNYNQFLSLFVEIIPKFERKKELLIEHCSFVKDIFELAYFMINNHQLVVHTTLQEMVDTPTALPISFVPKTKYWSKILAGFTDVKEASRNFQSLNHNHKPLLNNPEANMVVQNIVQNICYNLRILLDDLRANLNGKCSMLMDGDSNTYWRALDLKKALKTKTKVVGQLVELSKIYVLGNLLQRKLNMLSYEETTFNDKDIDDIIELEKWSQMPAIHNELKDYSNNLRHT